MIFDSDLVIAVVILTIGMAFFTTSLVEHTGGYQDVVKSNILHGKASHDLKTIISDGTVETAILLMNNNENQLANSLLSNRISVKNYEFIIGDEVVLSKGNNQNQNIVIASSVVIMNRTEGWYGVAWNTNGAITVKGPYFSELNAYNSVSGEYKKSIYYFNNSEPVKVFLKVYGS
ncbi:conserved hypothetical protein [Methanococcus vannielii SB]|uniref:Uncharacterized protein n=1 Tax=Methanococcus vannielii (strain ATCC 35089 / DSM 1224 / JCM 13029 / OCM 148 / SB) TaxID=406327 RepID=A6URM8_METVS|nr:hypothetical protein [Methanococcus vannielii]ABR55150.1 conserved hypothetical protein [Methanococcus vannielii SB]